MHKTSRAIPKILLAGLGRFGREHLKTWQRLSLEGCAELSGILVRDEQKALLLSPEVNVPVYTEIPDNLLGSLDGLDVVTPSGTHANLVRKYLPHTNILVEKPIATTGEEAQEIQVLAANSPHLLMVNHLYRFHPAILLLKKLMAELPQSPRMLRIVMRNPEEPGCEKHNPQLELLHPFDMLDDLLGAGAEVLYAQSEGNLHRSSLRFPSGTLANVEIGWAGTQRDRTINIDYKDARFQADLQDAAVLLFRNDSFDRVQAPGCRRPLENALRAFAEAISDGSGDRSALPQAPEGKRTVDVALASRPRKLFRRPRVAVMGGGIFGASCAITLAPQCDVTLLERHSELLTEATYLNQWRHHSGFHYPRSIDTVQEIQGTRLAFAEMFGSEVIRDVVSFYCCSNSASEITSERYLSFCTANNLKFEIDSPPPGMLDFSQVGPCLRTDEGVFNFHALRGAINDLLNRLPSCETHLLTEVTGAELQSNGQKKLALTNAGRTRHESFDFIINATYANMNRLAAWLGFPIQPLRFDLCEMLVLELPVGPLAVTILDGPFTSLVGTGENNQFLLSQARESILRSAVPADGLPPDWEPWSSNRVNMLRQCSRYLPVLQDAKIIESRFATRAVRAATDDYDGRPTVLTNHGFGCWSVLGGKIVTSVANAQTIARQMLG